MMDRRGWGVEDPENTEPLWQERSPLRDILGLVVALTVLGLFVLICALGLLGAYR